MAARITVVVSQGQSHHPAKRKLEEAIVAELLGKPGIEVTVLPHLYDLTRDGTGMLCLQGIDGDMIVLSWLYARAAHWVLARNGIQGQLGTTELAAPADDDAIDDEPDSSEEIEEKQRVVESLPIPDRRIYCIDFRASEDAGVFLAEIDRIAAEASVETVGLADWIGGDPDPNALARYTHPGPGNVAATNGNGHAASYDAMEMKTSEVKTADPNVVDETPDRRWYPVIDFGRCTNCMECIDFCLFGVYGIDRAETILVEQPDNCRKGCPACSRVCPENAIMFPQHKTPAIAGSAEVAGTLKIDLSKLFGAPNLDAVDVAVLERDEQLLMTGRDTVGREVGLASRAEGEAPRDALDDLIDQVESLDL